MRFDTHRITAMIWDEIMEDRLPHEPLKTIEVDVEVHAALRKLAEEQKKSGEFSGKISKNLVLRAILKSGGLMPIERNHGEEEDSGTI